MPLRGKVLMGLSAEAIRPLKGPRSMKTEIARDRNIRKQLGKFTNLLRKSHGQARPVFFSIFSKPMPCIVQSLDIISVN